MSKITMKKRAFLCSYLSWEGTETIKLNLFFADIIQVNGTRPEIYTLLHFVIGISKFYPI